MRDNTVVYDLQNRNPYFGSLLKRAGPMLLAGSWDLAITYSWAYDPTYSLPGRPCVGYAECMGASKPSSKYLLRPMSMT